MMLNKTKIFLDMIKFEHTIFALPFAFMGALLGSITIHGQFPSWAEIGWVLLAMFGARSAAMGLNRVIDKTFDKNNPRTAMRAIPAGLISAKEAWLFIVISFILLFLAASQLDPLAIKLFPIAVFFLVFYSYTKRFTWLCHLFLGLTIGLAPLGGWVAITGEISAPALILYVSIVFWIAGFDIIYACQDVEFDRQAGLHSIPVRFGLKGGLLLSRLFHLITAIGLFGLAWMTDLGWWYVAGTLIAGAILLYEHILVKPDDLSKVNVAFFTMNGTLSVVVFVFTLIDLVVRRL